ncbi:glutathione S-transferase N-terminal domain-containing protein [Chromobacterium vaccinii]|uniref:glutathione S-transferase N-terminal domain-containing protein n=1 Tax=Chromobacterium vaccinii TaxID=1108595 RepID=UPI000E171A64|nr:glutathione S-transferase N-terminal domain-containing protein [Chromobacterium vaccinii]SUX55694.1 putative glutathione S-transferase [Chromobacterium vaccinii]
MKLIASLTSPYARKVRIVLAEKKIDCPLEEDVPWNADTRVTEYNPLGKVPVLELDDGSTLYDSRVISNTWKTARRYRACCRRTTAS